MTEVHVYSQPGCGPCVAVKRHLRSLGVNYTSHDITIDPEAAERVRHLGYKSTPVVEAGDIHTHGYRREWLNKLADIIHNEHDPLDKVACELEAQAA